MLSFRCTYSQYVCTRIWREKEGRERRKRRRRRRIKDEMKM
jgi:hypothetical protein